MKEPTTAQMMIMMTLCFALIAVDGSLYAEQLSTSRAGTRSGEIRPENSVGIKMVWLPRVVLLWEVHQTKKAETRTKARSR